MFQLNTIKKVTFAAVITMSMGANATELKLSHQWSTKDVRHKVAQIVADEVAAAGVDLDIKIFPSKSLVKPKEQYNFISRNLLDMSVFPLSYAAGQQPAVSATLLPGLVKNHDHAARLTQSPFMASLQEKMLEDNVMVLVHGYLAGGFVGKDKCIVKPADVEGMQIRAAGKSFEQMLIGAGASITSMSSADIYSAMQTGVLNAANTSSSSFVSYRIYEQVKCYTPASENIALWFLYQPLIMSKDKFDSLNEQQQTALLAAAKKAEAFYLEEAKTEDAKSAEIFRKAGVEIAEMTQADFDEWKAIAEATSYKDFVNSVDGGQELLDMALSVD
jgi:TRAP-type C4-dicarboxylate transport system substrate-binding protein